MIRAFPIAWTIDRARVSLLQLALFAGWAILVSRSTLAQEPADKVVVGERVVLRHGNVALHVDGREIMRSRLENHIYRVESVDGNTVKLKAEGDCIVGDVTASEVIQVSKGIDYFAAQIEKEPGNAFYWLTRSLLWLDRRELDLALGDADDAARGTELRVYSARGRIRLARREYQKAILDFNEAIRTEPRTAGNYNLRGEAWSAKGDQDRAISDFNEAIRREPRFAVAYTNRGRAFAARKQFDKAVADQNEAIKLDPRSSAGLEGRGDTYVMMKDFDRAAADYDEAIKLAPNSASSYRRRGLALVEKKMYDKALGDLDQAASLDSRDAAAIRGRADLWFAREDYDKAIAGYNEAIRLDKHDASAYRGRARCWNKRRDFENALADASEAIRLEPDNVAAYRTRGGTMSELHQYDKAIADLSQAIRIDPQDAATFNNRGVAWAGKSEIDRAIDDYNQALRLDPRDVMALSNRASCWDIKRQPMKALEDFEHALKIDPQNSKLRRNIGLLYVGVGNYGQFSLEKLLEYAAAMHESKSWKTNADDESLTHDLLNHIAAYISNKKRDPKPAIALATKFCEDTRWVNYFYLHDLAAIYASANDGATAVKFEAKAALLAPESEKSIYNQYLENYQLQAAFEKKP